MPCRDSYREDSIRSGYVFAAPLAPYPVSRALLPAAVMCSTLTALLSQPMLPTCSCSSNGRTTHVPIYLLATFCCCNHLDSSLAVIDAEGSYMVCRHGAWDR